MRAVLATLRPVLDALPTIAVIAMVALVGGQAAIAGWAGIDRPLAALALAAVLMEAGASLVDLMGTAAFEVRSLAGRLGGFLASLLLMWFLALPAFVLAYWAGAAPLWLAIGFVVPRFLSTVLAPPRDALERLRILASANDRAQSLRLAVLMGMPVFATCAVVAAIGRASGTPPSGWLVAAPCLVIVAWLSLALAASWHAWSPGFGRFPQRLLHRAPWPALLDRFTDRAGRRKADAERQAERERARAWRARRDAGLPPEPNLAGASSGPAADEAA